MNLNKFIHKRWTETRYNDGKLVKTENFITYKFRYSHLNQIFNLKNKIDYFYGTNGNLTLCTVENEEFNISYTLLDTFGFQGRCWVVRKEKWLYIFRTTFYLTFILDESICYNSKCRRHKEGKCFHYINLCEDRVYGSKEKGDNND